MTYQKKQPRNFVLSARVEESLWRWVVRQAKKEGLKPSDWIRQTLQKKKDADNADNAND